MHERQFYCSSFSRQHTSELGESWFSIRNLPLTPRPKENEVGSNESIQHDPHSPQRSRIPASVCILPGCWHFRVHCDPGACKGGHEAAPDDVPDCSAAVQVGARRHGTIHEFDEYSSEKVENSEEQYSNMVNVLIAHAVPSFESDPGPSFGSATF